MNGWLLQKQEVFDFDKWELLRRRHSEKPREQQDYFYVSEWSSKSKNGDLLYNTCREIIDENRKDAWAHESLFRVFKHLEVGQRWPTYMKEYIHPSIHHRQYHMTQDPWIMAYCCAVHLGRYDLILEYKPSCKIFNLPDKWAWRRALLGQRNCYWFWRRITPHNWMQNFVYVFYGYMEKAYLK